MNRSNYQATQIGPFTGLFFLFLLGTVSCSVRPAVEVNVVDADGKPADRALVIFESTASPDLTFALQTDKRGRFTLRKRPDPGIYVVSVYGENAERVSPTSTDSERYLGYSKVVAIGQSGTLRLNIVLPGKGAAAFSVVDEDGAPVPGAFIALIDEATAGPDLIVAQGTTDYNGQIRFDDVPAGEHKRMRIDPQAAVIGSRGINYAPSMDRSQRLAKNANLQGPSGQLLANDEEIVDVTRGHLTESQIVMRYPPRILGRVTDTSGQPVLAEFGVKQNGRSINAQLNTFPDGQFSIGDLAEGYAYDIIVHHDALGEQTLTGILARSRDVNVIFKAGVFVCVLQDARTKYPVGFATFVCSHPQPVTSPLTQFRGQIRIPSQARDGIHNVRIRPATGYRFLIQADGYVSRVIEPVDIGDGEVSETVIIDMTPEAKLQGRIVDDMTNEPVSGVAVALRPVKNRDDAALYRGDTTDDNGKFEIAGLLEGAEYRLEIFARHSSVNYVTPAPRKVFVTDGLDLGDIVLQRSGQLRGVVINADGTPSVGTRVEISEGAVNNGRPAETYTDASGQFSLRELIPGTFNLRVLPDWRTGRTQPYAYPDEISIKPSSSGNLTIRLPPPRRLVAHLTYDGEPAVASGLSLIPLGAGSGAPSMKFTGQESGTVEAGIMEPGEYLFEGSLGEPSMTHWHQFKETILIGKDLVSLDFDYRSDAIRAEVADRNGQPVSRADVTLLRTSKTLEGEEENYLISRRFTSGSGRCDLGALVGKDYRLRIRHDGYETKYVDVNVTNGMPPVEVVLEASPEAVQ